MKAAITDGTGGLAIGTVPMPELGEYDTIPNAHSYQQMIPGDIRLDDALLMTGQKEIWSSTVQMEPVLGRRFLVTGAGITACLFGLFLRMKGAASPLTARWLTAGRTARTW